MAKLIVLGTGKTKSERGNQKGQLFEKLSKELLSNFGYNNLNVTRINYSGMEIDIEGVRTIDSTPFVGECKGWDQEVDSKSLQSFYGKFMSKWRKNKKTVGLFISLSNLNSHAKGFYNDNIKNDTDITFVLIEGLKILDKLYETNKIVSESTLFSIIEKEHKGYHKGDSELLYTKRGFFWVQYLLEKTATLPSAIIMSDSSGEIIKDKETIEYASELYGCIKDYKVLNPNSANIETEALESEEEIVLVRGNSACFEYQFPASPQFFFGREEQIKACIKSINNIRNNEASSKGILILANSGWGKSSLILKLSNIAKEEDVLVVPIDSRTATSQKYCLKAIDYAIKKGVDSNLLKGKYGDYEIRGFDSLRETLAKVNSDLANSNRAILIFFDQFENVFFKQPLLERLCNTLMLLDNTKNILFGFGWKSDLLGITEDFPYELRDRIKHQCEVISLPTFGETEVTIVLENLEKELRVKLKTELSSLIREYSQGYIWLLKKLCAHIIRQIKKGTKQNDLINGMLNIQELFEQDLSELYPEEREALRSIAKKAPLSVNELPETCPTKLLRSLIDKRLIVEIGHKLDVYWDIFRDYLNTGRLPVEDSYLLRMTPGSVLKALFKICEKKTLRAESAHVDLGYKVRNSAFNVIKELRLLGLIEYKNSIISLGIALGDNKAERDSVIRSYLKKKFRKHKISSDLLSVLEREKKLSKKGFANLLEQKYPYIKADSDTWMFYAHNFSKWLDCADIIIYDSKSEIIRAYDPSSELRTPKPLMDSIKKSSGVSIFIPSIQYIPIEQVIVAIGDAIQNGTGKVSPLPVTKSTWGKALRDATALGLLVLQEETIKFTGKGFSFYFQPDRRNEIFTYAVSKLEVYKILQEIFRESAKKLQVKELANQLNTKLEANWTVQTSLTVAKILINWSKVTGLYDSSKSDDIV